jgi:hypothetical protein
MPDPQEVERSPEALEARRRKLGLEYGPPSMLSREDESPTPPASQAPARKRRSDAGKPKPKKVSPPGLVGIRLELTSKQWQRLAALTSTEHDFEIAFAIMQAHLDAALKAK